MVGAGQPVVPSEGRVLAGLGFAHGAEGGRLGAARQEQSVLGLPDSLPAADDVRIADGQRYLPGLLVLHAVQVPNETRPLLVAHPRLNLAMGMERVNMALTPVEKARRMQSALKRARQEDKLDIEALAELISVTAEMEVVPLRIGYHILQSRKPNDRDRLKAGILVNDAAKTIIRAGELALKLGLKAAPTEPEKAAKPVMPDLGDDSEV